MQNAVFLSPFLTGSVVALLLYAALHDLAARTIPDGVSFAIVTLGTAHAVLLHAVAACLLTGMALFVASALAWQLRLLGGGDVKLLGALFVTPPEAGLSLLPAIAISGGLLACLYLAARTILRRYPAPAAAGSSAPRRSNLARRCTRVELWRIRQGAALPYGVAIAVGTIFHIAKA